MVDITFVAEGAYVIMQAEADSDSARGLADASADLIQSLDNLLNSLENPQANEPIPDRSFIDSDAADQTPPQPADSELAAATGAGSATMAHAGRTEPGSIGLQQRAPRFQGLVGELH